jgi:hypothetical protein
VGHLGSGLMTVRPPLSSLLGLLDGRKSKTLAVDERRRDSEASEVNCREMVKLIRHGFCVTLLGWANKHEEMPDEADRLEA